MKPKSFKQALSKNLHKLLNTSIIIYKQHNNNPENYTLKINSKHIKITYHSQERKITIKPTRITYLLNQRILQTKNNKYEIETENEEEILTWLRNRALEKGLAEQDNKVYTVNSHKTRKVLERLEREFFKKNQAPSRNHGHKRPII